MSLLGVSEVMVSTQASFRSFTKCAGWWSKGGGWWWGEREREI